MNLLVGALPTIVFTQQQNAASQAARKRDIILFLYESNLLRRDEERRIDLRGANLNGVRFEKSSAEACNL